MSLCDEFKKRLSKTSMLGPKRKPPTPERQRKLRRMKVKSAGEPPNGESYQRTSNDGRE